MKPKHLMRALVAAMAVAGLSQSASAQDGPIKIGVLADMSGVYADIGGQGSVEAVKMAIEDFGGKVLGKPIEVVSADGQNSRISPPISRGNGMTPASISSPTFHRPAWRWR
jgi:branched-chain amino acid transport system substrate-binding protein